MAEMKPVVPMEEVQRRINERVNPKQEPKIESPEAPKVEKPESPKVETPKAETPKAAPKGGSPKESSAEPSFSLEGFNKTYGLELKSDDEVKEYIENARKYKEVAPKFEEISKKYSDLELKSKVNPFADEFVEKLNDLKKNGATQAQIQAYVNINSVDPEKLSQEDKTILTYQLRDGLTEKEARIAFADEYKLSESDYEIDEDLSEEQIERQKAKIAKQIEKENIRLKRDAKGIDSFLSEYKTKVSTVEKPEDNFTKEWEKYVPQVKEVAPVIADSYKGLEVNLNGKTGEEGRFFKLEVPDDFKKNIPQIVENFLTNEFASGNPVKLNQDGIGKINKYLDRVLKAEYFDKYIADSNIHTESTIREEVTNKFSNSTPKQTGNKPPVQLPDEITQWKREKLKPRQGIFS